MRWQQRKNQGGSRDELREAARSPSNRDSLAMVRKVDLGLSEKDAIG